MHIAIANYAKNDQEVYPAWVETVSNIFPNVF